MSCERLKYYFEARFWSVPMVKMVVRKGVITKVEFTEITGQEYKMA